VDDAVEVPDIEIEGDAEVFHEVESEAGEAAAVEAVEEIEEEAPPVAKVAPKSKTAKAKGKAKK
jgi:hypothetical protein